MPRSVRVQGQVMQEHELDCPDCGDSMTLVADRVFTGYRCRNLECRGVHGCHPDGTPVGTPADRDTRKARMRAHEAFDRLWKTEKMTRTRAYIWLANMLDVERDKCHIGLFDVTMCKKLIQTVKNCYPELFPFDDPDVQ